MKKYLLILLSPLTMLLTGCSGEEVSVDGTVKESAAVTKFSTSVDGTRTSMDRGGAFYWTDEDHIFVYKNAKYIRDLENSVMGVQAKADFYLPGSYTDSSYKLYYVGQNSPNANSSEVSGDLRIVIPAAQSQSIPDDAEHFAVSGDCGIATAKRSNDGSYGFTLIHKASYLIFAPKDPAIEEGGKCKLKRVKVETTDGSTLCGTYTFDTAAEELNTAAGQNKGTSITLSCGKVGTGSGLDFPIGPTQDASKNGAFMVIEPGVHALKITYTVEYYGIDQDIVKTVSSRSFLSNHFYTIGHSLNITVPEFVFYFPDTYFMWDAQQWYWWGQDSYPTVVNTANSTYPRSQVQDPQRWYNTITSGNPSRSCKDMPTYNELTWYLKGDVYFDTQTEWSLSGIKQRGGIWLQKRAAISGFSNSSSSGITSKTPTVGKPSNTSNYFFLPALGLYIDGQLYHVGTAGYYWSFTRDNDYPDYSWHLYIHKNKVQINSISQYSDLVYTQYKGLRSYGIVAGKRPNGTNWFQ